MIYEYLLYESENETIFSELFDNVEIPKNFAKHIIYFFTKKEKYEILKSIFFINRYEGYLSIVFETMIQYVIDSKVNFEHRLKWWGFYPFVERFQIMNEKNFKDVTTIEQFQQVLKDQKILL